MCTEDEAARLVRSLVSAGVDTTVNGIGHLMLALASFPSEYAKLRAHPALAKRALDEGLRWDATVQIFFPTTTRDVEIGGAVIPARAKVLLFLTAANRDPRRWSNPDRFDLDRSASGHVGFGFGIHQCLGQMVARLKAELVLDALIPRVKSICLAAAPVRRLNNTLHALASPFVATSLLTGGPAALPARLSRVGRDRGWVHRARRGIGRVRGGRLELPQGRACERHPEVDATAVEAAVRTGALLRVRPKAMTVAVILAGLFPLLIGVGTGSEVMNRIPSTDDRQRVHGPLLSMLVVAAAYLLLQRRRLEAHRATHTIEERER